MWVHIYAYMCCVLVIIHVCYVYVIHVCVCMFTHIVMEVHDCVVTHVEVIEELLELSSLPSP